MKFFDDPFELNGDGRVDLDEELISLLFIYDEDEEDFLPGGGDPDGFLYDEDDEDDDEEDN